MDGLVISNPSCSPPPRAQESWGYNHSTLSSSRKTANRSISFNMCFLWPIGIGVIAATAIIAAATGGGGDGELIVRGQSNHTSQFTVPSIILSNKIPYEWLYQNFGMIVMPA